MEEEEGSGSGQRKTKHRGGERKVMKDQDGEELRWGAERTAFPLHGQALAHEPYLQALPFKTYHSLQIQNLKADFQLFNCKIPHTRLPTP